MKKSNKVTNIKWLDKFLANGFTGILDILITGDSLAFGPSISRLYKNEGAGQFTEVTGMNLTGVFASSVAWSDYDNDGDLDILLTGA